MFKCYSQIGRIFVSFTNTRFSAVKWQFCDLVTSNKVLGSQKQLIVAVTILLLFFQSASPSKKHYKTTKKYYKVLNCNQYTNNCTKKKILIYSDLLRMWTIHSGFALLVIDFKGKAMPKCRAATCPYYRNVLLEQTAITEKHNTNCHSFQKPCNRWL